MTRKLSSSSKSPRRSSKAWCTPLEPLESRQLRSATLDTEGTLHIAGTNHADRIVVSRGNPYAHRDPTDIDPYFSQRAGAVEVTVNGQKSSFDGANVKQIEIDAMGGNDLVKVSTETSYPTIRLSDDADGFAHFEESRTIPTTVYGGAGNDRIFSGAEADTIFGDQSVASDATGQSGDDLIDAGAGDDVVCGEAGNDRIFGRAGDDKLWGDAPLPEYRGMQWIPAIFSFGPGEHDILDGGDGNDQLTASKMQFGQVAIGSRLIGGKGDDVIDINNGARDRVNGGAGEDTVKTGPVIEFAPQVPELSITQAEHVEPAVFEDPGWGSNIVPY